VTEQYPQNYHRLAGG